MRLDVSVLDSFILLLLGKSRRYQSWWCTDATQWLAFATAASASGKTSWLLSYLKDTLLCTFP